jgi:hypothetical protein
LYLFFHILLLHFCPLFYRISLVGDGSELFIEGSIGLLHFDGFVSLNFQLVFHLAYQSLQLAYLVVFDFLNFNEGFAALLEQQLHRRHFLLLSFPNFIQSGHHEVHTFI